MASELETFGGTASKLSQNPLGIIALFIVLVYGFASLVVGLGKNINGGTATILVWFMVLFPVLVLGVFAWLVSRHHTKLYAPKDYKQEEHFLQALGKDLTNLKSVPPQSASPVPANSALGESSGSAPARGDKVVGSSALGFDDKPVGGSLESELQSTNEHLLHYENVNADLDRPLNLEAERKAIYEGSRNIVLVHVLTPSKEPKHYDVFVYIKRRRDGDTSDVSKAEFFFGKYWGNQIFKGTREGDVIGVSTSAYGPFLCVCLVTFTDGYQTLIYRYIDFEMGELVKKLVKDSRS